jgi:hypothetical protein
MFSPNTFLNTKSFVGESGFSAIGEVLLLEQFHFEIALAAKREAPPPASEA